MGHEIKSIRDILQPGFENQPMTRAEFIRLCIGGLFLLSPLVVAWLMNGERTVVEKMTVSMLRQLNLATNYDYKNKKTVISVVPEPSRFILQNGVKLYGVLNPYAISNTGSTLVAPANLRIMNFYSPHQTYFEENQILDISDVATYDALNAHYRASFPKRDISDRDRHRYDELIGLKREFYGILPDGYWSQYNDVYSCPIKKV